VIVADSSTWVAFLAGDDGPDVRQLDKALEDRQVLMTPAVLTELLSDSKMPAEIAQNLLELPLLEIKPGYWRRAGALRGKVLARRRRARLGDALIAQSCIDHAVSLLTRDGDFRAFAQSADLHLLI
jgi:predicted nucleic acid-binding protein